MIDQPAASRKALLAGPQTPDLHYMIALIDLLATCAEVCQLLSLVVDTVSTHVCDLCALPMANRYKDSARHHLNSK